MKLESKRLILRPISLDVINEVFEYRSNAEVNKYQGWIPGSRAEVEDFINKTSMQINEPGTWFQFVIVEKPTQRIIGDLGIHFPDDDHKQAELGITLHKDFQKLGYATEAMKRIIDFLFFELHKRRIVTSIDPANENSIRLVERIGFLKQTHTSDTIYYALRAPKS